MSEKSSQIVAESNKFMHKVFNNDPILFKSYINHLVTITTEDGLKQGGIVYTIDPVSESVVLIDIKEDQTYDLKIVMGHAIKCIEISKDSSESVKNIPELFTTETVSEPITLQRKEMIKNLLLENRMPVTEKDGIIHIMDTVHIEPPYGIENCISTNTIVLNRIQKILADSIK